MKKPKKAWWGFFIFLILLGLLWGFLPALRQKAGDEGARGLAESLRRAAVSCYALEGRYPPDLSYIAKHYGVSPDESRYVVYYSRFASNLMPEITVLQKEQAGAVPPL